MRQIEVQIRPNACEGHEHMLNEIFRINEIAKGMINGSKGMLDYV